MIEHRVVFHFLNVTINFLQKPETTYVAVGVPRLIFGIGYFSETKEGSADHRDENRILSKEH